MDSAALLRALLQPPDPPAVLVLLSYRSEDRGRILSLHTLGEDLVEHPDLARLPEGVPVLSEVLLREGVDVCVRALFGRLGDATADL